MRLQFQTESNWIWHWDKQMQLQLLAFVIGYCVIRLHTKPDKIEYQLRGI